MIQWDQGTFAGGATPAQGGFIGPSDQLGPVAMHSLSERSQQRALNVVQEGWLRVEVGQHQRLKLLPFATKIRVDKGRDAAVGDAASQSREVSQDLRRWFTRRLVDNGFRVRIKPGEVDRLKQLSRKGKKKVMSFRGQFWLSTDDSLLQHKRSCSDTMLGREVMEPAMVTEQLVQPTGSQQQSTLAKLSSEWEAPGEHRAPSQSGMTA